MRSIIMNNTTNFTANDRLVGLVVKASASAVEDPGRESRLRRDFFFFFFLWGGRGWSNHTIDLKIDTPVATLPGAWCYRASASPKNHCSMLPGRQTSNQPANILAKPYAALSVGMYACHGRYRLEITVPVGLALNINN